MELFPAIDLRGGKAVRLVQGDYDQMTVYSDQPWEVAQAFRRQSGRNLHLVDLDGAKEGAPVNLETIRRIVSAGGFFVEVGGGIRGTAGGSRSGWTRGTAGSPPTAGSRRPNWTALPSAGICAGEGYRR